jgi:hypothetical protein
MADDGCAMENGMAALATHTKFPRDFALGRVYSIIKEQ